MLRSGFELNEIDTIVRLARLIRSMCIEDPNDNLVADGESIVRVHEVVELLVGGGWDTASGGVLVRRCVATNHGRLSCGASIQQIGSEFRLFATSDLRRPYLQAVVLHYPKTGTEVEKRKNGVPPAVRQ